MCAINGLITANYTKQQARAIVKKMHDATTYTDDQASRIFHQARVYLAAQPHSYTHNGKRYTIVYNGQLLNTVA